MRHHHYCQFIHSVESAALGLVVPPYRHFQRLLGMGMDGDILTIPSEPNFLQDCVTRFRNIAFLGGHVPHDCRLSASTIHCKDDSEILLSRMIQISSENKYDYTCLTRKLLSSKKETMFLPHLSLHHLSARDSSHLHPLDQQCPENHGHQVQQNWNINTQMMMNDLFILHPSHKVKRPVDL